ncbi:hypothetical protein HYV81_02570 [Candidatus Woesearchaeota archaeon]|nr:hypothetical protein [Candidatus Woesearchaeota archaeon]
MKSPRLIPERGYEIIENPKTGIFMVKELMPFMNWRFSEDRGDVVVPDFPERFYPEHPNNLNYGFLIIGSYRGKTSGVTVATKEQLRINGVHGETVPWYCLDKVVSYPSNNGIMSDMIALSRARKIAMALRTSRLQAHEAYSKVSDINNEKWRTPEQYFCHGFFPGPITDREGDIFSVMCMYLQERPKTTMPK